MDTDDGICDSANCSLREAINHANTNVGVDNITFGVDGTITLVSTLPAINDNLTINGDGRAITISGNDNVKVMQVDKGVTLNVNHMTIVNSIASAISNSGSALNVANSHFYGNASGISSINEKNYDATLNVVNTTFSLNAGSAIAGTTVNVSDSIFSENAGNGISGDKLTVTDSLFAANTGDSINTNGIATVSNSTFVNNKGDGIDTHFKLSVTNSTFADNNWTGIMGWGGTISVSNSTFSGNHAAGIWNIAVLTVKNTVIIDSCIQSSGTITTASTHNLAADNSCGPSFTISDHINLGTLADNGGPTNTIALLAGSSAIDAGDNTTCLDPNTVNNKDQRGLTRITQQNPICDVGAFEAAQITCQVKPSNPNLKAPANETTLARTRPTLKWNTATCANTYTLIVKNMFSGSVAYKKAGLTMLKQKTDPLPTNNSYKWFVKACNSFGCSKSVVRQFKIVQ